MRVQLKAYAEGGLNAILNGQSAMEQTLLLSRKTLTGRRKELWDWLRENGPAKRNQIEAESGLPKGTIATLFNKSRGDFERDKKGRWVEQPTESR